MLWMLLADLLVECFRGGPRWVEATVWYWALGRSVYSTECSNSTL